MQKLTIPLPIITAAFAFLIFSSPVFGADPKPLSKVDAANILTNMGYKDLQVVAIVQGSATSAGSLTSGPNVATVIGVGRLDGKVTRVEKTLYYDAEIGWFHYDFSDEQQKGVKFHDKLQIWSAQGPRTIVLTGPAAPAKDKK